MSDDPNKQDGRDLSKVAGEQNYEVQYFADANGITPEQTRDLIAKHGNDRETLKREAKKMQA